MTSKPWNPIRAIAVNYPPLYGSKKRVTNNETQLLIIRTLLLIIWSHNLIQCEVRPVDRGELCSVALNSRYDWYVRILVWYNLNINTFGSQKSSTTQGWSWYGLGREGAVTIGWSCGGCGAWWDCEMWGLVFPKAAVTSIHWLWLI